MFAELVKRSVIGSGSKPQYRTRTTHLNPMAGVAGRTPDRPKKGARGLAGIRWDILHGTLTVREFTMMATRDIAYRYKVTSSGARWCRYQIAKHGAGDEPTK